MRVESARHIRSEWSPKTRPVGPSAPCPLLQRGVTLMPRFAHTGITELSGTAGAPNYETNRMSQNWAVFSRTTVFEAHDRLKNRQAEARIDRRIGQSERFSIRQLM